MCHSGTNNAFVASIVGSIVRQVREVVKKKSNSMWYVLATFARVNCAIVFCCRLLLIFAILLVPLCRVILLLLVLLSDRTQTEFYKHCAPLALGPASSAALELHLVFCLLTISKSHLLALTMTVEVP